MSITIHKYTVSDPVRSIDGADIFVKFSEIFAGMPGVYVTQSMIHDGNIMAIVYGLEAGKDQIVFYANLQSPSYNFGLCEDGYNPIYSPGSIRTPYVYWPMMPSTPGDWSVSDFAVAVKDGKVIGFSQRVTGFTFFHYTDDGVIADRQWECTSNFGQQWTASTGQHIGSGIACGDCIRVKPGQDPIVWIGTSYGNVITANVSNYNLPTGKILKYESVIWDQIAAVIGSEKDYPVQMTGAGVIVEPKNYPSYKTIQIDTQKYIHMGANCWLPYDSIVEHSETV